MTFLELTTQTAPAARSCIREFDALPAAHLRPSRSSTALSLLQDKELPLIRAIMSRCVAHLESVAAFASEVEQLDAALGEELAR